jgi:hypothetical protein
MFRFFQIKLDIQNVTKKSSCDLRRSMESIRETYWTSLSRPRSVKDHSIGTLYVNKSLFIDILFFPIIWISFSLIYDYCIHKATTNVRSHHETLQHISVPDGPNITGAELYYKLKNYLEAHLKEILEVRSSIIYNACVI